MPEDVTKSVKVTFARSLPMGTRATFTHEKELWIAFPASKNKAMHAVIDRLIGIHRAIAKDMINWINQRPGDADLVGQVLERVTQARTLSDELVIEKSEMWTS